VNKSISTVARARAARRCGAALAFIGTFVAIAIGAAASRWSSPLLPPFEACCLVPVVGITIPDLSAVVAVLRGGDDWRARRRATRHFRRQLDALQVPVLVVRTQTSEAKSA